MKIKSVAVLSPMCLLAFVGSARADLEPYSFGASETILHESNLSHSLDADRVADWLSTTEFRAALDQAVGRDHLVASAAVDLNRYKRLHDRDSTGYQAAAEFDWSTIGDLSGAFGADSRRQQYVYGDTADLAGTNSPSENLARNLQTDNHLFARVALGGESRWTLFAGVDANRRNYTAETFRSNEEQQWSTNAGTRYSVSPDLSFGLTGAYTRGEYPHYELADTDGVVTEGVSKFQVKSLSTTSKWQASGNSALDASLGYTTESNETLSSNQHFINGSLNWTWTPPSHFTIVFGLKRSSDADAATTGINTGIVNANNLNGASVNNIAMLDVSYAVTAKISLDANASFTQRKYSDVKVPDINGVGQPDVNGSTRTSRFYLTAHYQPTRTTDLSCGGGRETRHADTLIAGTLPGYSDNYLQCMASIRFD